MASALGDYLDEFKIELDPPPQAGSYLTGSEVTGALVVNTTMPKFYESLVTYIVCKGHTSWIDKYRHIARTETKVYFNLTNSVWNKCDAPDGHLPPGEYRFQFRFMLPPELPPSYEHQICEQQENVWIRYAIGGCIKRGYPYSDRTVKRKLTVLKNVDIDIPQLRLPFNLSKRKAAGCRILHLSSGPVTTTLELPRTGFCIGEEIPFRVTIKNETSRNVYATIRLEECCTFHAQNQWTSTPYVHLAVLKSKHANPYQSLVWAPALEMLTIPATAHTTLDTNLIKLAYRLKVIVHIPYVLVSPVLICPLTIGNVTHTLAAPPHPLVDLPHHTFVASTQSLVDLPHPLVGLPRPLMDMPHPLVDLPPGGPALHPSDFAMPPSGIAPPTYSEWIKMEPPSYEEAIVMF